MVMALAKEVTREPTPITTLPIGSLYTNHNDMVIRPWLIRYGYPRCINTLGSNISTAAGCYLAFIDGTIIRAPPVGPIGNVSSVKK